jgi:hypothetical protein
VGGDRVSHAVPRQQIKGKQKKVKRGVRILHVGVSAWLLLHAGVILWLHGCLRVLRGLYEY